MTSPNPVTDHDPETPADKFHKNLKKSLGQDKPAEPEKTPEPENQEKDFCTKSGAFAIVDASILKDLDNPLAKEAVIIPIKHKDAVFTVKAEYDDTILRSLTMGPKPSETEPEALAQPGHEDHKDGDTPQEVTPPEVAKDQGVPVPSEGNASPLSHDDSVQRALRKHQTPRSRRHMKGSDLYRRGDPTKKAMARVKRVGRQEAKPEVEDAFQFLINNSGKQLSEDQLRSVKDQALLSEVLDLMLAMTFNNWNTEKSGVTNGDYLLEDDRFKAVEGTLLFNDKPINLEFDWLYGVRQQMKALTLNQAWDIGKLVK